jgi:pyrimidine deaminase RibD-like protein
VVVGVVDPNPLVGGKGVRTLQQAGIVVCEVGGAEADEAYDINREFMERMKLQAQKSSQK